MFGALIIIAGLMLIISTCCQISRLHDLNISGWWIIPIILTDMMCNYMWHDTKLVQYITRMIIITLFLLLPGTKGPNKFGVSGS